ncbi:MAG: Ig-like domain-containing protein [Clostridium sp.]|nr:Ig-like domain-containing protein [Clostridium sp.]
MQETRRVKGKKIFLILFALTMLNVFQTNSMSSVQAVTQIPKPVTTIPVQGLTLTPNNRKMQIGGTLNLLLTINPSNATDKSVTWSSSNEKVATVTSTGKVTAVGYGTANITVTSSNGKRDISYITVEKESSEQATTTEERTTEKTTEITTEKVTEKTTEKVTEQTTENATADDTGNGSENYPTEKTTEVNHPAENEQQTELDTQAPTPSKIVTIGTKLVGTGIVYKVTDVEQKTVSCVKPANTKKTNIVIPAIVRYEGTAYKVNAIDDFAFKNNKKIKKVVIGKNVTAIGKQAFYGCKKLKMIDVRTKKLSKVGSKAFKKISKKPTVKVPKGKIKKYSKLFRGKI